MDTNTKERKEEEVQEKKQEILQDSVDDKQNDEDVSCNEQGLIETIIRMYQQYVSLDTISEFTNLSVEEIQRIVDDNKDVIRKMDEEKKQKELRENKEIRCKAYIAGRKKGIDDGIESALDVFIKRNVVINMYKDGISIGAISLYTSVSIKEIEKIIEKVEEK